MISTIAPETLSPLDTNAITGDLVFRVCGSSRDGQIVRLKSAKCTIGSAEQCTLRLRARGIRPVHCLVLRGAGGTVVRRWDTDTRLNGHAFTNARLAPGDHLSIGGIDLEVVDPCGFAPQQPSQDSQATEHDDRRQEELDRQQMKLQQEQAVLQQRQQQWHEEQAKATSQLDEQAEDVNAKAVELDARQEAIEVRQQQLGIQQTEGESNLAERAEQLAADRAELDKRREEFEMERREWEEERTRIDSQQIDSVSKSEPVDEAEAEEVAEEVAEEASDDAPVDLESVLRRIGATGLLRDDEESSEIQEPDEPEPEPTMSVATSERPTTHCEHENEPSGDEEESVDEYMARLMNRVSGSDSADYQPPPSQQPRHEPVESGAKKSEPSPTPADSQVLLDPSELSPRAAAPEDQAGLAAMRELANLSAGSAISRHSHNKLLLATRTTLTMTLVVTVCGVMLMLMWYAQYATTVTFYAAMACFVVATFFATQYIASVWQLVVNKLHCPSWCAGGKTTEEEATTEAESVEV